MLFHEDFLTVFFSDWYGSALQASVFSEDFFSSSAHRVELEDCIRLRRIRRFSNSAGESL